MKKQVFNVLLVSVVVTMSVMSVSCGSTKKLAAVSVTDQKEMPKQVGMPAEVEVVFPCTGAALVATSIPMLTIAYKNRRKAKSFSFTTSSLSVDLPNGEKQTQPALGLCLNF